MTLDIRLFGPPAITLDGEERHVDTRKAIALLAYLLLTPGRHSRDRIALLFWPESDNARASLRRTLSTMNKAIDGAGVEADRSTITYQATSDTWADVLAFTALLNEVEAHTHPSAATCAACIRKLQEAAALYRGDFLEGFTLRDSPEFDDWQYIQAEDYRRQLSAALGELAHAHALQHEFSTAIDHAQRWLHVDPLHEPAHRWLMRLFAWNGQRSAALQQYRECLRTLEQELGVDPLPETTELYTFIKEDRLEAPPQALPTPPTTAITASSHANRLPLVGREAEWAVLMETADHLQGGHVIAVTGEAGIGKTRLVQQFDEALQHPVLHVRCHAAERSLAYGPISGLLRDVLAADDAWLAGVPPPILAEVARLLPDLHPLIAEEPPLPPLSEAMARTRFFDAVTDFVLLYAQHTGRLTLIVDDAHWADSASQDLLAYLMQRLSDVPVLLVLTWRPALLAYDNPLSVSTMNGQRGGWVTVLTLSRLSAEAVAGLLAQIDLPEGSHLTERLIRETEGLPFFLDEYIRQVRTADDWALPPSVQDLLRSRLADISDVERQLLSTAAVIGRSFDFDTLREASGRTEEETVTMLEALLTRGLIQEDENLTYDFYHSKLRSLLYEETSMARRRLLHRRAARILERTLARHPAYAGQVANHFEHAREDERAAAYYVQAAEHARSSYAVREALNHYQAALALGADDPAALHEACGDMHTLLGAYADSLHSYEAAAALQTGDGLGRIEHKIGQVYHRLGEWELAERGFQDALAAVEAPGPQARILADWSLTAHRQGEAGRAAALAERALALADGDAQALAQAHNLLGVIARSAGDLGAARTHLEESRALAVDLGARVAALNNLALVLGATGEIEEAIALAEQALDLCQQQGDRHREAALYSNLGDLHHQRGDEAAAEAHITESVRILADIGEGQPNPAIWKLVEW